jgi:hypothetical protein
MVAIAGHAKGALVPPALARPIRFSIAQAATILTEVRK